MDLQERIMELSQTGLHCSQIMMQLSLDLREQEEPFTIRALGALGGGMFARRTCGTLTGAAAMLSSYFPRTENQPEPHQYQALARALVEWFEAENKSLECRDLVIFDPPHLLAFCPGLMERTFVKCLNLLEENGIDPSQSVYPE